MKKSVVGGILTIISGAWGFLFALLFIFYVLFFIVMFRQVPVNGPPVEFIAVFAVVFGLQALFFAALGALAVVGGIFAIKQRRWGWALAGAIAGNMTFMWTGVVSVIFISMARDEFTAPKAPAVAALPAQPPAPEAIITPAPGVTTTQDIAPGSNATSGPVEAPARNATPSLAEPAPPQTPPAPPTDTGATPST